MINAIIMAPVPGSRVWSWQVCRCHSKQQEWRQGENPAGQPRPPAVQGGLRWQGAGEAPRIHHRDSLSCCGASQHVGLHQPEEVPGNAAKLLSLPSSRSIYMSLWWTSGYPWARRALSIIVGAMTGSAWFWALSFPSHYALFLPSC